MRRVVLLVPYASLAVYMADPSRTSFAYFKGSPARLYHSCFTAYIEADRPPSVAVVTAVTWPRTAAVNLGVYGLVVTLRHLGLTWLDAEAGRRLTDLYGVVLLLATVGLGWRESRHPQDLAAGEGRARAVVIWLALVGLASYRSPFVGFAYGGASTMWLLWLMTASARRTAGVWVGIGAFAFTASITSLVHSEQQVSLDTRSATS